MPYLHSQGVLPVFPALICVQKSMLPEDDEDCVQCIDVYCCAGMRAPGFPAAGHCRTKSCWMSVVKRSSMLDAIYTCYSTLYCVYHWGLCPGLGAQGSSARVRGGPCLLLVPPLERDGNSSGTSHCSPIFRLRDSLQNDTNTSITVLRGRPIPPRRAEVTCAEAKFSVYYTGEQPQ